MIEENDPEYLKLIESILEGGQKRRSGYRMALAGKLEHAHRDAHSASVGGRPPELFQYTLNHQRCRISLAGLFFLGGQKMILPPVLKETLAGELVEVIAPVHYRLGDDFIVVHLRFGIFHVDPQNLGTFHLVGLPPISAEVAETVSSALYQSLPAFVELRKKIIELRNRIHESSFGYDHGLRLLGDLVEHDAQRLFDRLNSKPTRATDTAMREIEQRR